MLRALNRAIEGAGRSADFMQGHLLGSRCFCRSGGCLASNMACEVACPMYGSDWTASHRGLRFLGHRVGLELRYSIYPQQRLDSSVGGALTR